MRPLVPSLIIAVAACASPSPPPGQPLEIPAYRADDPRPGTGGFVRDVRLVEEQHDGTLFILMAFVVGDKLTVGAMTQGPFEGTATWRIGAHSFSVALGSDTGSGTVPVDVDSAPTAAALHGDRAGFGDYRWVTVDLDAGAWMPGDVTPLALTFRGADGVVVALPPSGHFAARRVAR